MSTLRKADVASRLLRSTLCHVTISMAMSLSPMSHVNLKKRSRHPVGFKGQGPFAMRERNLINITGDGIHWRI